MMPPEPLTIYNLFKINLLITLCIVSPAFLLLPLMLLTDSWRYAIILMIILSVVAIWYYYTVCCLNTLWTLDDDGISITANESNKYYPFEEVFIRWDDITGYSERKRWTNRQCYTQLEIYTYSGNDITLYTEDSATFTALFHAFERQTAQKSPYLKSDVKK